MSFVRDEKGLNKDNHGLGLHSLLLNSGSTFVRQLVAVGLGIGLTVFLARALGPEGNGTYSMAVLLPMLLSSFLNLGLGPANVYYLGRGNVPPGIVLRANIRVWLTLSLLGLVITVPVILLAGEMLFPRVPPVLLWLSTAVFPLLLLQSYLLTLLQGMQDFQRFNAVSLVAPVTTLIFAVITVWLLHLGVFGAVLAFGSGQISGVIAALYALRLYRDRDAENENPGSYVKMGLRYGWKAYLSNVLTFVNYRADLFLVNFFLTPAAAGIYVVAVKIAERLWLLSQAVSTVILPRLSELHGDEKNRRRLTPLVGKVVLLLTALGAIFVALIISPLVHLVFGSAYMKAAGALLWLLPGIVLGSLSRVLSNDIAARGRPELNMYTALMVVAVNVTLNVALIPGMGINGAAIATTLAYSVDAVAKLFIYAGVSGNAWWRPIVFSRGDWDLVNPGNALFCKSKNDGVES